MNERTSQLDPRDESGMALITVMIVMMVVTALAVTAVKTGVTSQFQSRRSQDWNAALPAADAGIDDALTRLNTDENFAINPSSVPFTPIPQGSTGGEYKYTVDNDQLEVNGNIQIESTGLVRGVERTVRADVRRDGFIDFLYFTDYETIDPQLYQGATAQTWANANCERYAYAGRPAGCTPIVFVNGDVINGPAHSNDQVRMTPGPNGPVFNGAFTTSWQDPAGDYWFRSGGTGTPTFNGGNAQFKPNQELPDSNAELATLARKNGCLFTGPTSVVLKADGTMDVVSPYSKDTNPGKAQTDEPSSCQKRNLSNGQVHNFTLPPNGVVHVQDVPASTTDVNAQAGCIQKDGRQHPLGYPKAADITAYPCTVGDLFIEGTLSGQLTASANNDVVITWDLTTAGGQAGVDLIGLVANNFVWVHHPVDANNVNLAVKGGNTFANPKIEAAILALNHSFAVQNYNRGAEMGKLRVVGSIAQKFRGAVGTSNGTTRTGYAKDYNYDTRLQFVSPPNFLKPVNAAWSVVRWEER